MAGIIVGSDTPRPIGYRGTRMTTATGTWRDQPFVVIREATRDEWHAFLDAEGVERKTVPPPHARFYEIATD